jgi:hypothetical protein
VVITQHFESQDFNPTPAPTPEPDIVSVNNNTKASPSPAASPTPGPTILPTPLVSAVEFARPGLNIGTIFAALIGLACAGYIAYLGSVIIRK